MDNMDNEELELRIRPIGYIRTGKAEKFHARHQPLETESEENVLELVEGAGMREAIQDLGGFIGIRGGVPWCCPRGGRRNAAGSLRRAHRIGRMRWA